MQVLRFKSGHAPELAGAEGVGQGVDQEVDELLWIDVERTESDWYEHAKPWLRVNMDERHINDTLNDKHAPYYDGTDDYDLLVVRALCPECPVEEPTTRPVAFIITSHVIVSVRPAADPVFTKLHQRFLSNQRKSPTSPAGLLYLLLNQIADGLLASRDQTSNLMSQWQDRLLEHSNEFEDWRALMRMRSQLRRMEMTIENQQDAIDEWRDQTTHVLDVALSVRFNDLQEHLRRIYNHTIVLQHDIDALVQIYFSANTQRTNDVLQFLTILSAIFLPLNLLAGIFGMNFDALPLLRSWYGPWVLASMMVITVISLLVWFKRKQWL